MVSKLFQPPFGVLFTFPSRYWFTIDLNTYLALPVSSGRFTQAIRVLSYSGIKSRKILHFCIRDFHPLGFGFPANSTNTRFCNFPRRKGDNLILQPRAHKEHSLGFSAFARRYLRNTCWSLFLRVLRCFTSPGALLVSDTRCSRFT